MPAASTAVPGLVAILMALFVLGEASNTMFVPAMPALVDLFGVGPGIVQYGLSGFALAFAAGQLLFGPLSDRFGRRPCALAGMAIFLAGTLVAVLAPDIGWLILGRVLQGLGACAGYVVARAMVRDAFGREGAAPVMGFLFLCLALAVILSPVIGGAVVDRLGWQTGFWLQFAIAAVMALACLVRLPETNRRLDRQALRLGRLARNYGALFRNPRYLAYMLTHSFAYVGILAFFSGGAFALTDRMGLSRQELGQVVGLVMVGFLLGTLVAMLAHRRLGIGIRPLVSASTVLMAGAPALLLAIDLGRGTGLHTFLALQFAFMFGAGLMAPNTAAGVMMEYPDRAGLAAAVLGSFQMAAAGLAAAIVGILSVSLGLLVVAAAQIVVGMASLILFHVLVRRAGRPDGMAD